MPGLRKRTHQEENERLLEYHGLLALVVQVAKHTTQMWKILPQRILRKIRHPKYVFDYAPGLPLMVRSHFGDIASRVQEKISPGSLRQMLLADVRELLGRDALDLQLYPVPTAVQLTGRSEEVARRIVLQTTDLSTPRRSSHQF